MEFVPLNWWLDHCRSPFIADGWHLSARGSECWATAAGAAVNQLRSDAAASPITEDRSQPYVLATLNYKF